MGKSSCWWSGRPSMPSHRSPLRHCQGYTFGAYRMLFSLVMSSTATAVFLEQVVHVYSTYLKLVFSKVRLQTMKPIDPSGKMVYSSATDCFSKIVLSAFNLLKLQHKYFFQVRHEGPMVLFRGMSALALFSVPRFALLWYYSR